MFGERQKSYFVAIVSCKTDPRIRDLIYFNSISTHLRLFSVKRLGNSVQYKYNVIKDDT